LNSAIFPEKGVEIIPLPSYKSYSSRGYGVIFHCQLGKFCGTSEKLS